MGLPFAGKTTLAKEICSQIKAVHFNADRVRANVNNDLGFSHGDRIEHARRMGAMCDIVVDSGFIAVADFICPTKETREAFGKAFVVWLDTVKSSPYLDTNALFEPPSFFEIKVTSKDARFWGAKILKMIS